MDWFKENHPKPIPQWKIDYLNTILQGEYHYITDFVIGTQISRKRGEWTVACSAGVKSYDSQFRPNYTPDVLIRLGIFGGTAIHSIEHEIPIEWILYGLVDRKIKRPGYYPDALFNYYGILTSFSDDDRKFFQWFCRYYLGKRNTILDTLYIREWKHRIGIPKYVKDHPKQLCITYKQYALQWGYKT